MDQQPKSEWSIKGELDAMEPSQILDMNRRVSADCSYSTRPIHKKRRHVGAVIGISLGTAMLLGTVAFLLLFDIGLERIDGGYSLRVQRKGHHDEAAETASPNDVDLPDENLAAGQLPLNPYPVASNTEDGPMSLQDIYDAVRPSVVSVIADGRQTSTGTGVIMDEDGLIITCAHVTAGQSTLTVILSDDRQFEAAVVGVDSSTDLAILRIPAEDLPAAEFGSSDAMKVGDRVVAIGDPLGMELRGTMTEGIISGVDRRLNVGGTELSLLQTNTALNAGNSGGPLINCYGQVIGINSSKIGSDSGFADTEGLGFAIPTATVQRVVEQLLEAEEQVPGGGRLGLLVTDQDPLSQMLLEMPDGVYIVRAETGSDAYLVGIQPGDLLISVDDVAVPNVETLELLLENRCPGDTVRLGIFRCGMVFYSSVHLMEFDP